MVQLLDQSLVLVVGEDVRLHRPSLPRCQGGSGTQQGRGDVDLESRTLGRRLVAVAAIGHECRGSVGRQDDGAVGPREPAQVAHVDEIGHEQTVSVELSQRHGGTLAPTPPVRGHGFHAPPAQALTAR